MSRDQNSKLYDLEERTFQFAKKTALYVEELQKSISNPKYSRQLVDSSGPVGADYIEAIESLGKKDL